MHGFLFGLILIGYAAIAVLLYQVHNLKLGMESHNERLDAAAEELQQHRDTINQTVGEINGIAKAHGEDAKDISARISQLTEEQEKIRRKASQRGPSTGAFESLRTFAESNSRKPNADHDQLVALAEGRNNV